MLKPGHLSLLAWLYEKKKKISYVILLFINSFESVKKHRMSKKEEKIRSEFVSSHPVVLRTKFNVRYKILSYVRAVQGLRSPTLTISAF